MDISSKGLNRKRDNRMKFPYWKRLWRKKIRYTDQSDGANQRNLKFEKRKKKRKEMKQKAVFVFIIFKEMGSKKIYTYINIEERWGKE